MQHVIHREQKRTHCETALHCCRCVLHIFRNCINFIGTQFDFMYINWPFVSNYSLRMSYHANEFSISANLLKQYSFRWIRKREYILHNKGHRTVFFEIKLCAVMSKMCSTSYLSVMQPRNVILISFVETELNLWRFWNLVKKVFMEIFYVVLILTSFTSLYCKLMGTKIIFFSIINVYMHVCPLTN